MHIFFRDAQNFRVLGSSLCMLDQPYDAKYENLLAEAIFCQRDTEV